MSVERERIRTTKDQVIAARVVGARREKSGAWFIDLEVSHFVVSLPDGRTIHPVRLDGFVVRAYQKGRKPRKS